MEIRKLFIDSNISLNILLEERRDYENSIKLLKDVENKKFIGVTTLINLMEILFVLRKVCKDAELIKTVENFFEIENLKVIIPNEFHVLEAYNLQKKFKFHPNDAIFVSVAKSETEVIVTRDEELRRNASVIVKCITPEEI